MSEYGDYTSMATSAINEKLMGIPKGFSRRLDEVEIHYKDDPKRMAALHNGDGYYMGNRNPYERFSGNYNTYENAFLTMQLGREYE
jgi:hypothetical protein